MSKDQWYEYLTAEFARLGLNLDPEEATNLDGMLWRLASEIATGIPVIPEG